MPYLMSKSINKVNIIVKIYGKLSLNSSEDILLCTISKQQVDIAYHQWAPPKRGSDHQNCALFPVADRKKNCQTLEATEKYAAACKEFALAQDKLHQIKIRMLPSTAMTKRDCQELTGFSTQIIYVLLKCFFTSLLWILLLLLSC